MKALVTGGTGFIGSWVTRLLLEKGYKVKVLYRSTPDKFLFPELKDEVEFVKGDILDSASVENAITGCDVVFHLAAYVKFASDEETVKSLMKYNVEGTKVVLEAAYKAKVSRFIFTSSTAAIGTNESNILDENFDINDGEEPTPYGYSKYLAEKEVKNYASKGLDAVIVNPAVVIGYGLRPTFSSASIFKNAKAGRLIIAFPGGFNVVDVKDVANGHILALEKGKTANRYILGGHNIKYKDFFELVNKHYGIDRKVKVVPAGLLKAIASLSDFLKIFGIKMELNRKSVNNLIYTRFYSSEKAKNELGYTIRPLEESIKDTIEWLNKVSS